MRRLAQVTSIKDVQSRDVRAIIPLREIDLQLARGWPQRLASLSRSSSLCPMADDLAAATGVVVDAPVGGLDRQPTGCRSPHHGVEAPAPVIDLDDVSRLDALEPHWTCNCRLLAVRWLVDGMNVIGTRPDGWWRDRHRAMVNLVDLLERWAAAEGEDVTVVFEQPPSPPIRSTVIEVAHAPRPRRDAADDEIVRLLAADSQPGAVRVVTSDLWLSDRVHAAGATVEPSAPFRAQIEQE